MFFSQICLALKQLKSVQLRAVHTRACLIVDLHCVILARYGKSKKQSRAELESVAKRVRFEDPKTEVQLLTERVCILEKKILDL